MYTRLPPFYENCVLYDFKMNNKNRDNYCKILDKVLFVNGINTEYTRWKESFIKIYSNLTNVINPVSNHLNSANASVYTNDAYAVKISPKVYLCHGYIRVDAEIASNGSLIATGGNLRNSSSLVLISPDTHVSYATLYDGNYMCISNSSLPVGYYYVSGCLIERN